MNAGFQAKEAHSLCSGIIGQMIDQQLPESQTAKLRPHIHALKFPILGAKELNAAAAGRSTVIAQYEKRDCLRQQLFDAITVTAYGWIKRLQMRFQLRNKHDGVGAVGAFGRDDG